MDQVTSLAIGGVAGSLTKFLKMGGSFPGWRGMALAVLVTTIPFAVWGYAHNDFTREASWDYFVNWCNALVAAAAGFHGTEEALQKFNSTGDGSAVNPSRFNGTGDK